MWCACDGARMAQPLACVVIADQLIGKLEPKRFEALLGDWYGCGGE